MDGIKPMDGERKLAAIMFTDMVGFTGITQQDEKTALEMLDFQRRLVRSLLVKYHGREIQAVGDGFLVEFASALDAVQCAVEIQQKLGEENERRTEDSRILIRVGIHLGDVIHRGNEVAGDAVNIASRVEPLSEPGGVCVTEQVYASVVNQVEVGFETMGIPKLKNVASPIEIYKITGLKNIATATVRSSPTLPRNRIAVLPFVNISQDLGDEYFADGLTEELISAVSQIKSLRVIARTSVMRYKSTDKPISLIAKELNVGSVLEGSVRKSGEKIRISINFIDTSNEEPRWSKRYDREIRDIFDIQSEIAQNVAEILQEQVQVKGDQPNEGQIPRNTRAYILYLRGRQLWNKRSDESLNRAIQLFDEAIKIDPGYARAYAGMADSYAALALLELMAPNDAYPKARQASQKALLLDPDLAEAHTSMGLIHFQYDWSWEKAEQELLKAIEINPNYAPAHHFYADLLKALGRFDEALDEIEKARELDPLSLAINTGVGHVLYLSRQYDKAIEEYQRAVELDPTFMATHLWFGRPYLEKGMYAEAITELHTAVQLSGESTLALAMLGHGLASAGHTQEAEHILEKLKERSLTQYVPSYWIAVIYNGFKDKDQVIHWMHKAYQERSSWLVWCNVEPRFAWLRDDPEFAAIIKLMKYPR